MTYTNDRKLKKASLKMLKKGIRPNSLQVKNQVSEIKPPFIKGLFLDDVRNPDEVKKFYSGFNIQWKVVRNQEEFLEAINERRYEAYSFDWHLGGYPGGPNIADGMDLLKEFIEFYKKDPWPESTIPHMFFHSSDRQEAFRMERLWNIFEFDTYKGMPT